KCYLLEKTALSDDGNLARVGGLNTVFLREVISRSLRSVCITRLWRALAGITICWGHANALAEKHANSSRSQTPPACSLDDAVELGRVSGRRTPDIALDARESSVRLAYRVRADLTSFLRLDGDKLTRRSISVPSGYHPASVIAIDERTVIATTGLCPNVPRKY